MPRSSSTSSSRAWRGVVVITSFGIVFAAILALSLWRLDNRGLARTREDQLVHEVSRMRGVHAKAILLGDSVTQVAAYNFKTAAGVYSLLTNGYLRLAGNYLLFRRYLEHNTTESMYLFIVPSLLSLDVSDDEGGGFARYTYLDSVFTRPDEVEIFAEAGARPRRKIVSTFERLLKAWYPNRVGNPFGASLFSIEPSKRPPAPFEGKRVPPSTTPQVRYFLERFQADCATHRIRCVIVEEPALRSTPRVDVRMMQRLYPGLTWFDFHDYATFDDEAFPDRLHLSPVARGQYVGMIQSYIAPLFSTPGETMWAGDRVTFSSTNVGGNPFTSNSYHNPERWGVWTSSASVKLRFKAAIDLVGGEIRLGVRLPPVSAGGLHWPVSVWIDGVEVLQRLLPPDGSANELVFKTPGGSLRAGNEHSLEIRIPQTVRAPGSDPRNLGVGLDYVEYCGPTHVCQH